MHISVKFRTKDYPMLDMVLAICSESLHGYTLSTDLTNINTVKFCTKNEKQSGLKTFNPEEGCTPIDYLSIYKDQIWPVLLREQRQ